MFIEEKQVVRIGEDLGELLNWSLEEPFPLIQVMVDCEAPLILFRETVSEQGELFRIRFEYIKLQNHCKLCYTMTHDSRSCLVWLGPNRNHQDRQRKPSRRQEEDEGRRGKRVPRVEMALSLRNREHTMIPMENVGTQTGSPKRKAVRRNLTEELGDTILDAEERRVAKRATKDWVQKSFTKEDARVGTLPAGAPTSDDLTVQTDGSGIHSNSWYRNTEEEVKVAKLIYAQNEAWEIREGNYRESEKVEKDPVDG